MKPFHCEKLKREMTVEECIEFQKESESERGKGHLCKDCEQGIDIATDAMLRKCNSDPESVKTKVCRICGKEKPIDEFYKQSNYKDGHETRCKACVKKLSQKTTTKSCSIEIKAKKGELMSNIIPFKYDSKEVRTIIDKNGEPWFVAKDVCEVLGIGNVTDAVNRLDNDEKMTFDKIEGAKGGPARWIVNEPGLYTMIIRSNKPEAKKFKRWITHEVLPSIRKTGRYSVSSNEPKPSAKPLSLAPVAKELNAAMRMAKVFGFKGNQAAFYANRAAEAQTGFNCARIIGVTHLIAEDTEKHLTPSDIGKMIGDLSGKKVNQLLESIGLQASFRDAKNHLQWKVTAKGESYAVLKDTSKKRGDGTPVQQIFWKESVLELINSVKAA